MDAVKRSSFESSQTDLRSRLTAAKLLHSYFFEQLEINPRIDTRSGEILISLKLMKAFALSNLQRYPRFFQGYHGIGHVMAPQNINFWSK